jgi:hypothetical protein
MDVVVYAYMVHWIFLYKGVFMSFYCCSCAFPFIYVELIPNSTFLPSCSILIVPVISLQHFVEQLIWSR